MLALQILAALFAAFVLLRLSGVDGNRFTASALALTPYAVVAGVAIGGVLTGLRQWWVGGGVLALSVLLAALVAPRAIAARPPQQAGRGLRIMASNLYFGRGDAKTVVELVREHRVDVLNLLELTVEAAEEFARAGLFDLLPHQVLRPSEDGGAGSGIASRYPLRELDLPGPALLEQPSARIEVDGAEVEVVAVHPVPPTGAPATWKAEIAGLPAPLAQGPIRILAGDFNASLDHGTFRALLRTGYRDAAAQLGAGLRRTWPALLFPPPVTIDHVLFDGRAAVADYRVFAVPRSDHLAVFAELVIPETRTRDH
ncbi:MAG TPA: endonuclease/exonuclease/phosphatase family protein [Pseudonocardiaceae bacterium]|nr:endonuclease/exonuclease/phosphatase family protein [Pseudonocardiaceae bacterium]